MAPKCTGRWLSWIGVSFPPSLPANDGQMRIGRVRPNHTFDGIHERDLDEFDVDGECQEGPDHIEFTTDEGLTYSGEIVSRVFLGRTRDVVVNGNVSGRRGKRKVDDDWVAVKTT